MSVPQLTVLESSLPVNSGGPKTSRKNADAHLIDVQCASNESAWALARTSCQRRVALFHSSAGFVRYYDVPNKAQTIEAYYVDATGAVLLVCKAGSSGSCRRSVVRWAAAGGESPPEDQPQHPPDAAGSREARMEKAPSMSAPAISLNVSWVGGGDDGASSQAAGASAPSLSFGRQLVRVTDHDWLMVSAPGHNACVCVLSVITADQRAELSVAAAVADARKSPGVPGAGDVVCFYARGARRLHVLWSGAGAPAGLERVAWTVDCLASGADRAAAGPRIQLTEVSRRRLAAGGRPPLKPGSCSLNAQLATFVDCNDQLSIWSIGTGTGNDTGGHGDGSVNQVAGVACAQLVALDALLAARSLGGADGAATELVLLDQWFGTVQQKIAVTGGPFQACCGPWFVGPRSVVRCSYFCPRLQLSSVLGKRKPAAIDPGVAPHSSEEELVQLLVAGTRPLAEIAAVPCDPAALSLVLRARVHDADRIQALMAFLVKAFVSSSSEPGAEGAAGPPPAAIFWTQAVVDAFGDRFVLEQRPEIVSALDQLRVCVRRQLKVCQLISRLAGHQQGEDQSPFRRHQHRLHPKHQLLSSVAEYSVELIKF